MLNSREPQASIAPPATPASRLDARQIMLGLGAGTLAGLIDLGVLLSLAALIFSGQLAGMVANGIGLLLVGSGVMTIVLALLSSRTAVVSSVQDAPAVVVALIAANIAARMPAGSDDSAIYATVVAAIVLTTLITGATFLLLGKFRLGSLVRYLPYPVIGGFLAGTGWLLTLGGLSIMIDVPSDIGGLQRMFQSATLWQWLPGLILGFVILLALRRIQHVLLLPGLLLAAIVLFYGWLAVWNIPLAQAQAHGWLLGPFPGQVLWSPLTPAMLGSIHWSVIGGQLSAIGAVVTISVIGLLLNVSGLQLARRSDIDLNQELRAAGAAQLVGGLIGSPPGFQALSLSMIGHHMGARTRLVGVAAGLVSCVAFFFGAEILSLIPRVVLGGMVCYLGLAFLAEWLYDTWFKLSRLDYAVIAAIVVLIAVFGILPGVIAGLTITLVLFVMIYSRIDVVKHMLTGAMLKSRVIRSSAEQGVLRVRGEQIGIFRLFGFIFFGTADALFERVRQRTLATDQPRLRFVLLDFRLVPRIDSTAMLSFSKLQQLAEAQGLTLVFTQLAPNIRQQFDQALLRDKHVQNVQMFPDMDRGLEWCENELLADVDRTSSRERSLSAQLAETVPEVTNLDSMLAYFERRTLAPGEHLFHLNEPSDAVFFVETGQLTAWMTGNSGVTTRLETVRGGRAVGELAFYLGRRRTAAVIADETSCVYSITQDGLRRLEQENPAAAATFHKIIAHLLSERVIQLIDTVSVFQRT